MQEKELSYNLSQTDLKYFHHYKVFKNIESLCKLNG